jgi:hypothetical protein
MPSSRSTSTTARRMPSLDRMLSISRANRRLGIFCAERRASYARCRHECEQYFGRRPLVDGLNLVLHQAHRGVFVTFFVT